MNNFNVGDLVVRKAEHVNKHSLNKCLTGEPVKIQSITNSGVVNFSAEDGGSDWFIELFELYQPSFDLKTMPWKILVNSPEESRMAQEWLFKQGVEWKLHGKKVKELNVQVFTNCRASDLKPEPNLLYSYDAKNSVAPEIKLTFGVTSVEYPEPIAKETEAQKKMKELEDKQREIAEELAKLRESM